MKVAIHQPEYWPVPKLLAKWYAADMLILLDTVQFDRTSLQHRCRLLDQGQPRILTIDYRHAGPQQIRVVETARSDWPQFHWNRLTQWYRDVSPGRLNAIHRWLKALPPDEAVSYYAWESMRYMAEELCGLKMPPVVPASALMPPRGGWGTKGELVRDLCVAIGATTYLSGQSGARYLTPAYNKGVGDIDGWAAEGGAPALERVGVGLEIQQYKAQHERDQPLSGLHVYLAHGPEAVRRCVEPPA